MRTTRTFLFSLLTCGLAMADVSTTTAPTTSPATTSRVTEMRLATPVATQSATSAVQVSADAKPLLAKINAAYATPRAASLRVKVKGNFDVAGRARTYTLSAVGYTDGEGRFDHEVAGVGRIVQTEDRVIVFDARRNAFGVIEQVPAIRSAGGISASISDVFIDENPSLLLLITNEPAKLLERGAVSIAQRDGALVISAKTDIRTIYLNDDGTIRSMIIDYVPLLQLRGVMHVKSASATLTYTPAADATVPETAYQFDVPSGAVEFRINAELMKTKETPVETPDHLKQLIDDLKSDPQTRSASD